MRILEETFLQFGFSFFQNFKKYIHIRLITIYILPYYICYYIYYLLLLHKLNYIWDRIAMLTLDSNMARKGEWVYDELLNYVASPLFQAPVITFMETNCLRKGMNIIIMPFIGRCFLFKVFSLQQTDTALRSCDVCDREADA